MGDLGHLLLDVAVILDVDAALGDQGSNGFGVFGISLAPAVPGLMAENATFIASGIIDSRKDEVIAALEAAGLTVQEVKEKRGWECIICKKA